MTIVIFSACKRRNEHHDETTKNKRQLFHVFDFRTSLSLRVAKVCTLYRDGKCVSFENFLQPQRATGRRSNIHKQTIIQQQALQ